MLIVDGEVVNEYVARALPALSSAQLLEASRKVRAQTFPPGATIIAAGELGENFYIITRNQAEVLLQRPAGSDLVVERLGPGQFFGEVSLVSRSRTSATVRATAEAAVDVLVLDGQTFQALLAESAELRQTMESVSSSRLALRRTAVEQ